nr:3833_t:CDS:2 [Entrophospora candida]
MSDTRVVVGIDFGTTYSGFAYSHEVNPEIETNQIWPTGVMNTFKINTVLMYDENGDKVESWGFKALVNKKARRRIDDTKDSRPIELFKLHLGRDIETSENLESRLNEVSTQNRLDYKKAIADYLGEMAEAAAIYCRKVLGEHFKVPFGTVVKGAVEYGLNMKCVKNRVLKKTYGVKMFKESSSSSDNNQDDLGDDDVDDKRCVEIILRFGETEIKAMAKVKGTGEIKEVLINLES